MKRALKECQHPRCHVLTRDRYCEKHKPKDNRASAAKRGYCYKWNKARIAYLVEHPLCECKACQDSGQPLLADVVDHIIPHRGNMELFWDKKNWQAMNHICHSRKTAKEDGGFGNYSPPPKKVY